MRAGKHFSGVATSLSCLLLTCRKSPDGFVEIMKVCRQIRHLKPALSFSDLALDAARSSSVGPCGARAASAARAARANSHLILEVL